MDLPLTVNAVIHRGNIDEVGQLIDLAVALGAKRLEIAHTQYYGWAFLNRSWYPDKTKYPWIRRLAFITFNKGGYDRNAGGAEWITVAGGHGELGSRMFRIGHIGYYDVFDITTALAAVELLLVESGADIERGTAVSRALESYRSAVRA